MPVIDISQLARLDELGGPGAPPHRPAPGFGPAPGASPTGAVAPPTGAVAPPTAAFRPPPEVTATPISVERSTRAIRIANEWQHQAPAQRLTPVAAAPTAVMARSRTPIGGVVAAVVLMAAFAIA